MVHISHGEYVRYLIKCGGVAVGESDLGHCDPADGVLRGRLRPTAEFDRRRARVLAGQDLELLDEAGALVSIEYVRVYREGTAGRSQESLWLEVSLADARTSATRRRCG